MTQRIEVSFPVDMKFSDDFQEKLHGLLADECNRYEKEHPDRAMWVFAYGDKPLWNEPHEPTFDESVLNIEIAERERYADEKEQDHG